MRTNRPRSRTVPTKSLSLVLLSDTHELHREIDVPDGDILIHAGDFTMFSKSMDAIADFNKWLGELPHRHKIIVPGNHEFFLEHDDSERSLLDNAIVLINESIEVEGLSIWGSPVTPLDGAAFGLSSDKARRKLYSMVPDNVDVLITHGPPFGILDTECRFGFHQGCHELLERVKSVQPQLHVCGHIHGASGVFRTEHTLFVNAARLGLNGELDGGPTVFEIKRQDG